MKQIAFEYILAVGKCFIFVGILFVLYIITEFPCLISEWNELKVNESRRSF